MRFDSPMILQFAGNCPEPMRSGTVIDMCISPDKVALFVLFPASDCTDNP